MGGISGKIIDWTIVSRLCVGMASDARIFVYVIRKDSRVI